MPFAMGCICAAMAAVDAIWPAVPSAKARSSIRTRNQLTNEPNMPEQHKTGPESWQAARAPPASRTSRWMPSTCREPRRAAAFCRHALLIVLFLSMCSLISPQVLAGASERASGVGRTTDHVHVTARRVGDAILVTLRIDDGYHVNANPASNDYLIPTTIAFHAPGPARIAYPSGTPFKPAFADEPIQVYEGTATVAATFPPGALDQVHDLSFTLTAQACTTAICLPPDDITARARW